MKENIEEEKAIKYYQNKDISFSVDFDTKKLLEALGITEEDSFEKHQIRFKTLLNLIKKMQKENEELKSDNYELNNIINDLLDSIPKQKVKDEIEYINKFEEDLYKKANIIQVLQDLLEEKGE